MFDHVCLSGSHHLQELVEEEEGDERDSLVGVGAGTWSGAGVETALKCELRRKSLRQVTTMQTCHALISGYTTTPHKLAV